MQIVKKKEAVAEKDSLAWQESFGFQDTDLRAFITAFNTLLT